MISISSLLLCITALLYQPNPDDPLNTTAAATLKRTPPEFEKTAREWTQRYAIRSRSSGAHRGSRSAVDTIAKLGDNVRRTGMVAATDDVSRDPLATYQTANGYVITEDEALDELSGVLH